MKEILLDVTDNVSFDKERQVLHMVCVEPSPS